MSLIATIKAKQLEARKSRDPIASSLLTTLLGEASMPGKNDGNRESTDAEVVATIKKFLKNATETCDHLEADVAQLGGPAHQTIVAEMEILKTFLPQQLTDLELEKAIAKIVEAHGKNKGLIMKALKAEYDGRYDGKRAAEITSAVIGQ